MGEGFIIDDRNIKVNFIGKAQTTQVNFLSKQLIQLDLGLSHMRDLFAANYFLRPYDPLQSRWIYCLQKITIIFSIFSVSSAPVKLGKPIKIVLDVMNLSSVLKNVPVEPFLCVVFLSAAEHIYHSGRQFLEVWKFHEKIQRFDGAYKA